MSVFGRSGGHSDARRLAAAGALLACSCALAGSAIGTLRFGWTSTDAMARVEGEVRQRFDEMTASLARVGASIAERTDLIGAVSDDPESAGRVFDMLAAALTGDGAADAAATVYDAAGLTRAWTGRPSELPPERVSGPEAYFIVPGPLGLRVFHVRPVVDDAGSRLGTVAVERALSPRVDVAALAGERFLLETSLVPVAVRTRYEGAGDPRGRGRFLIRSPLGEPLLEVEAPSGALGAARLRWFRGVAGMALAGVALTLALLVGPLLDRRARMTAPRAYVRATVEAMALVVAARAVLWLAIPADWLGGSLFAGTGLVFRVFGPLLRSPVDFLATAAMLLALVALIAPGVASLRARFAHRRSPVAGAVLPLQAGIGLGLAVLLAGHQAFVHDAVVNSALDTLRFSPYPWDPPRLAMASGLVLFQAANLWAGVLLLVAAASPLRLARGEWAGLSRLAAAWAGPTAALLVLSSWYDWPVSRLAVGLSAGAAIAAARVAGRALARYRHASQASRLLAAFATLLVPALLLYPSMAYHTDRATRRLVETDFASQPVRHPQALLDALERSLDQIDSLAGIADLVESRDAPAVSTESAFRLWSQTDLAARRLTSAIELYDGAGSLSSRFALNLPEYTPIGQTWRAAGCGWEVFGEAAPFGSEERRMLHAERGICRPSVPGSRLMRVVGTIVVHVMLDYRTLPFLSQPGPYLEVFRAGSAAPDDRAGGGDVELVIYGWGLLPGYFSGPSAWLIDEPLFDRIYASREPFWTMIPKGERWYHVYFSNDRYGIYALGYPASTPADHLQRLAELVTLPGAIYVVFVLGAAAASRVARDRARLGPLLLREIRASFYRKLFLAFVFAAVVPVLILALVARAYFVTTLREDVEAEAARSASVAQRVIEEFAAQQQRGPESLSTLTDDLMVLISQIINQDVNVFDGPDLVATSQRDLFASGLLPRRTPHAAYRAIRLQRLPSFVGEDAIAAVRYIVAAAPLRLAGHDAIVTVPQGLRQREIEREIDDLNRGINLAALVFILLGAGIGLPMAERIADPVRRLTRATRRVARGDFDARILVRSTDELQRLVDAFNAMAAELKTQAAELERTHRLEAWAEMARQVAHEIKNPLTPIQLSAEHLRRVHADRGEPLSPVLDRCVATILNQVRLLRQISAEFSAFATVPTPEPARVEVAELVEDVIAPYRAGLDGRTRLAVTLDGDLPPVFVDRTLVGRALVNLVENALHAMPEGGVLRVAAHASAGGVSLEVADTGIGMDEQSLERIFEPYFSTRATGTGLGLTIARRNIESSRGRIEVFSERGRGTTVRVWLPPWPGDAGAAPASAARPSP